MNTTQTTHTHLDVHHYASGDIEIHATECKSYNGVIGTRCVAEITGQDQSALKLAICIAAAPELLEALEYNLGNMLALQDMVLPRNMKAQIGESIKLAQAAIAKAEGN